VEVVLAVVGSTVMPQTGSTTGAASLPADPPTVEQQLQDDSATIVVGNVSSRMNPPC
jgi:hypothetical protein